MIKSQECNKTIMRKKVKTELLTSFKSTLSDDAASIQSHLKTINKELKKTKPRDQLPLPCTYEINLHQTGTQ